ncbi:Cys-tRNA(Pro) deacylase [Candidatus Reidiella endopervernicosa]|uniref:Cys-tRNA(Pro) deacylase n=1 Tax=Candidatus Reidiella endopervernicosa TaxID=2738883 RepID=A0A6N0HSY2_9GAMM|nr:Cys-tRNA(Pro) deacylase [Candidatus Reidiella endopervernicosa]QKQ25518.1 Cys-tRNA(Pro) deacylase [Candidatus Reidiella endopervernicosa]
MTPAINIAKDAKNAFTIHEYQHDPKHESFGLEAAEKLGVDQQRVFKTLVVKLDNCDLAIGVLPVSTLLSWGVAIFARVCFGHPSPSKQQKLNATVYACGAPTVLRTLRNHLFAALHNFLTDSTPT